MADHGLTGTHHIDGSPCTMTEDCPWSAEAYMRQAQQRLNPLDDPQFPDRPKHPDFWRMSEAVLFLDGEAEEGGKSIPEISADLVDLPSLVYMAEGRIAGMLGKDYAALEPDTKALLLTLYLGGFTHGIVFQKRGGHRT